MQLGRLCRYSNSPSLRRSGSQLNVEHDPEKACPGLDPGWTPVSRLREANLWRKIILKSASEGEGRSEKIMLQPKN
jgi:hypothetical protein